MSKSRQKSKDPATLTETPDKSRRSYSASRSPPLQAAGQRSASPHVVRDAQLRPRPAARQSSLKTPALKRARPKRAPFHKSCFHGRGLLSDAFGRPPAHASTAVWRLSSPPLRFLIERTESSPRSANPKRLCGYPWRSKSPPNASSTISESPTPSSARRPTPLCRSGVMLTAEPTGTYSLKAEKGQAKA